MSHSETREDWFATQCANPECGRLILIRPVRGDDRNPLGEIHLPVVGHHAKSPHCGFGAEYSTGEFALVEVVRRARAP